MGDAPFLKMPGRPFTAMPEKQFFNMLDEILVMTKGHGYDLPPPDHPHYDKSAEEFPIEADKEPPANTPYKGLFKSPKSLRPRRRRAAKVPQKALDVAAAAAADPDSLDNNLLTAIPAPVNPVLVTSTLWNKAIDMIRVSTDGDNQELLVTIDQVLMPPVGKSATQVILSVVRDIIIEMRSKQLRSQSTSRHLYGQAITILERFVIMGRETLSVNTSHGGLPWAALRFVYTDLTKTVKLQDEVVAGLAAMVSIFVRCHLYAEIHLSATLNVNKRAQDARNGMSDALVQVYSAALLLIGQMTHERERSQLSKATDTLFSPETLRRRFHALYTCEPGLPKAAENLTKVFKSQSMAISRELPRAKGDLAKLLEDLVGMQPRLQHLSNLTCEESLRALLHPVETAFYEDENGETVECLGGTRIKILQDINDWNRGVRPASIFWLRGPPGSGKSTVCRTMARELDNNDCLGASFFFHRLGHNRNSGRRFFPTIAFQLARKLPDWHRFLIKALRARPELATADLDTQFKHLILDPLIMERASRKHVTSFQQLTIVIDALDNCIMADAERILQLLVAAQLRCFITTRPDHRIRPALRVLEVAQVLPVFHETNNVATTQDMILYMNHRFDEFRSEYNAGQKAKGASNLLSSNWPGDRVVSTLAGVATPLFTVADTLVRMLRQPDCMPGLDTRVLSMSRRRGDSAAALRDVYVQVLNRLRDKYMRKNWDKTGHAKFQAIMNLLVTLYTPLDAHALAPLLGLDERSILAFADMLRPVLEVTTPSAPIRFRHLSFRDFLFDHSTPTVYRIEEKKAHASSASQCCQLLSRKLHAYMGGAADTPGIYRSDISDEVVAKSLSPAVQYAALGWVKHLWASGTVIEDGDEFHQFLKSKFFIWLEALSLMKKMSEAAQLIDELRASTDPAQGPDALDFILDAKRFLSCFGAIIAQCPLQVYQAGLIFSPQDSKVRVSQQKLHPSAFVARQPSCIQRDWSMNMRNLPCRGRPFSGLLATSEDGKMALARSGGVVEVWDPLFGDKALEADHGDREGEVDAAAFSGEGRLALATRTRIEIWDLALEKHVTSLVHDNAVTSMAFSQVQSLDCVSLTSCGYARMYDVTTGVGFYRYDYDCVSSRGQLSSKGSWLAIQAADAITIYRWTVTAKRQIQLDIASSKGGGLAAFDFSADESLLAAASDVSAKVWSIRGGACLWICDLRGASATGDIVRALTLSKRHVAMTSANGNLVVCEFVQYGPHRTPTVTTLAKSEDVLALTMLSDADTLVTVTGSTIRLWDPFITAEAMPRTPEEWHLQQKKVTLMLRGVMGEVRFTYGASHIVQASERTGDIFVSSVTDECAGIRWFGGAGNYAVSDTKPLLAIAHALGGVSILDTSSMTEKARVAPRTCCTELAMMDFSADAERLVVAVCTAMDTARRYHFSVQVWHVETGECELSFCMGSPVVLVAASAASGSETRDAKVAVAVWNKVLSCNTLLLYDSASSVSGPIEVRGGSSATAIGFLDRDNLLAVLPGGNARVLDTSTGATVRDIRLAPAGLGRLSVNHLSLDHDASSGVRRGDDGQGSQLLLQDQYHVSSDGTWIMKGLKRMIWLPPQYRAAYATGSGLHLAIACSPGETLHFEFKDEKALPPSKASKGSKGSKGSKASKALSKALAKAASKASSEPSSSKTKEMTRPTTFVMGQHEFGMLRRISNTTTEAR